MRDHSAQFRRTQSTEADCRTDLVSEHPRRRSVRLRNHTIRMHRYLLTTSWWQSPLPTPLYSNSQSKLLHFTPKPLSLRFKADKLSLSTKSLVPGMVKTYVSRFRNSLHNASLTLQRYDWMRARLNAVARIVKTPTNWLLRSKRCVRGPMIASFVVRLMKVFLYISIFSSLLPSSALAHGFNANTVEILRLSNGQYRVVIHYTHVELGEYRQAHIDFDKKEEAIKTYQDLAQGADFFLGDVKKSIHFHTPPEKNKPF